MKFYILILNLILMAGTVKAIEIEASSSTSGSVSERSGASIGLRSAPQAPTTLRSAPSTSEALRSEPSVSPALRATPFITELEADREAEELRAESIPTGIRSTPEQPSVSVDPSVEEIAEGLRNDSTILLLHIEFEYDSDILTENARSEVAQLAAALLVAGSGPYLIIGNTDTHGPDDYNTRLSIRRAEAVRTELVIEYGFSPEQLQIEGRGKSNPIDFTGTSVGDQRNRRVEVVRLDR